MIKSYLRVSTNKQDIEVQKSSIVEYCKGNGLVVDEWINAHVSSRKDLSERGIMEVIEGMGKGDVLIVNEISRIARSVLQVFEVLNVMLKKGIVLISVELGVRIGDDDINGMVMAFAFGLSAQIERKMISERTKAGLAEARRKGKPIGRKRVHYLDDKVIDGYLEQGSSKKEIAKKLGISTVTLWRHLKQTACG